MKHSADQHLKQCGCRSAGECTHAAFADDAALDALSLDFIAHLRGKLRAKARAGKSGWDDPGWTREDILSQLIQHIDKGDMLDVAAFAMFAWNQES